MSKSARQTASNTSSKVNLIGAIDQGTSSTRFLVFENNSGKLVASSQIEVKRIVPAEGWVEMDPKSIISTVNMTIADVYRQLSRQQDKPQASNQQQQPQTQVAPSVNSNVSTIAKPSNDNNSRSSEKFQCENSNQNTKSDNPNTCTPQSKYSFDQISCIGICNQRESTVVWDKHTGEPLYNVIVWLDNRTKDIVDEMIDLTPGRDFNFLKDKTGLPMSTYFSAFKLKWLIDNVPAVRQAIVEDRLLFGTVDTWILWNLTNGAEHSTDVTNASRTFLMDIEYLEWDLTLCKLFGVPANILPRIKSSADDFGLVAGGPLKGLPITGVIGDQSAALFGHNCLQLGQTKATFGTGCFIMQNIGPGPLNGALSGVNRDARRGLVTTVGYKLRDKPAYYALEGSVKIAGAALTWLRDNLQLISDYSECDTLIDKTTHSAGVFFVPALGGLYAPYWDPNASGIFIGLSQFSRREHLVRATFDSIAFQTNDILNLMRGVTNGLMIDGGLVKSDNMCQILADITGYDIVRPSMAETSALGAAMVAGHGANLWSYDTMLQRSSSPTLIGGCASAQQTHHYPPKALHYEERFSSIRTRNSDASLDHMKELLQATTKSCCGDDVNRLASLDSELTTPDNVSDQTSSPALSTTSSVDDDDVDVDDVNNFNNSAYANRSNADSYTMDQRQQNFEQQSQQQQHMQQKQQQQQQLDVIRQAMTESAHSQLSYLPGDSAVGQNCKSKKPPSSGYSSGDNYDNASSSAVEDPIVASELCQRVNLLQQQQHQQQQEHFCEKACKSFTDQRMPSSQANNNLDRTSDICSPNRLSCGDKINNNTSVETTINCNSISGGCNSAAASTNCRVVDVFQSYISLEHRTELVNTWQLAVERSMKWTKVDHEEVRKNDYQRLSSLPLSLYLFFSLGMFACSSLLAK